MKLSTTRWTKQGIYSVSLALFCAALLGSCVSAKPTPGEAPAETPAVAVEAAETPVPVDFYRAAPAAAAFDSALPAPLAPLATLAPAADAKVSPPIGTAAQSPDPSDMSPLAPSSPSLIGAMDEPTVPLEEIAAAAPIVPEKAAAPAVPAAPIAKPSAQPPAAKGSAPPLQTPAAKATAPASVAAPAPAPAAAAKPTPKPTAPTPAVPAYSLPSAPTSSARSVDAAAAPIAEIRVDAVRGERFELRFIGSGWTYLGDEESRDGIRYETRRFEGNEAIFALRPEKSEDFLLRFQRQDPVSGERQSSLVRVSVREPGTRNPSESGAASAQAGSPALAQPATQANPAAVSPSVPSPGTNTPAPTGVSAIAPAAAPGAANSAGPAAAEAPAGEGLPMTGAAALPANEALLALTEPIALLSYARSELDAKRARSALDALDRYVELFKRGSDELFFLYGLAYEQDTPYRDIKLSYANYKRVRDEYPRSTRWKASAERVAYMERHYYGLR